MVKVFDFEAEKLMQELQNTYRLKTIRSQPLYVRLEKVYIVHAKNEQTVNTLALNFIFRFIFISYIQKLSANVLAYCFLAR